MTKEQGRAQYSHTRRFTEAAVGEALPEPGTPAGHLLYSRHFAVLFCMAALLAATAGRRPVLGAVGWFGVYGAIHAAALVTSLRARRGLPGKLMFIALAASLSMSVVLLCLRGSHHLPSFPGKVGLYALATLASGLGAAGYALLIRKYYMRDLSHGAASGMFLLCGLAALAVMLSPKIPKTVDGLWIALPWWFVFSAGLRYYDVKIDFHSRKSIK